MQKKPIIKQVEWIWYIYLLPFLPFNQRFRLVGFLFLLLRLHSSRIVSWSSFVELHFHPCRAYYYCFSYLVSLDEHHLGVDGIKPHLGERFALLDLFAEPSSSLAFRPSCSVKFAIALWIAICQRNSCWRSYRFCAKSPPCAAHQSLLQLGSVSSASDWMLCVVAVNCEW